MNEVLKTIAARNSCRDFADTPLTDEQVKAIADAALAAPSAMNRQPWHITMITDKSIVDELDVEGMSILAAAEDKAGYNRMMDRGGKLLYNAPCLVIITNDGSHYAAMDSGILCQNVTLAAQSLGLTTCIVGMAGVPLNGPRAEEYKARLKFPDGYAFAIGILVGTAITGKEPHELDTGKITYIAR